MLFFKAPTNLELTTQLRKKFNHSRDRTWIHYTNQLAMYYQHPKLKNMQTDVYNGFKKTLALETRYQYVTKRNIIPTDALDTHLKKTWSRRTKEDFDWFNLVSYMAIESTAVPESGNILNKASFLVELTGKLETLFSKEKLDSNELKAILLSVQSKITCNKLFNAGIINSGAPIGNKHIILILNLIKEDLGINTRRNIFIDLFLALSGVFAAPFAFLIGLAWMIPAYCLDLPYLGKPQFLIDSAQWFVDSLLNAIECIVFPIAMVNAYNRSGSMDLFKSESTRILETLFERFQNAPDLQDETPVVPKPIARLT
ncbi:MAG: hypothetical protein QNK11_00640 [Legionella sp.]|nr:hypothetical protein [Legionella sp.]